MEAQFKNLQGQVVLETDAEVGETGPMLRPNATTASWECCPPRVVLDWHWCELPSMPCSVLRTGIVVGDGPADKTPLPAAGQAIAQATGNFYQAARGIINTIKTDTFRQVIIGSRDDVLVVHTIFQGVEKLTLEQLAQGQDVFFGYFRTPQASGLPSGFYTVRILQSEGQWLARFVNESDKGNNAKGNTVKEVPAEVGPATKTQFKLFLGIEHESGSSVVFVRTIAVGDSTTVVTVPIRL
jgi:hypothetical protein